MTAVIAAGGIDMSVGSTMGLCGICTGLILTNDWPLVVGIAGSFALGGLVGLFNGLSIAYLGMSPFILTLAMLSAARSLALVISDSQVIYIFRSSG